MDAHMISGKVAFYRSQYGYMDKDEAFQRAVYFDERARDSSEYSIVYQEYLALSEAYLDYANALEGQDQRSF